MSRIFKSHMPDHHTVGWNIPRPENASGFVDSTDKSRWLVPYHNLMHQGKIDERHRAFISAMS